MKLKDDKLKFMHEELGLNIAKFISIAPTGEVKHILIDKPINQNINTKPNQNIKELLIELINKSKSGTVNIRSFSPEVMKGNKLVYGKGIDNIEEILQEIESNCKAEKYSIINETIDVKDGGVSGVVMNNIMEFSPNETPKCVDKDGVCHIGRNLGYHILRRVYGFTPTLNLNSDHRVEFSIHPQREGIDNSHTVVWEYEETPTQKYSEKITWPNNFSRHIGDKVFGLLVAEALGFKVPLTTVIPRNVAPFTFGSPTGLYENWIRTAPAIKSPGEFYTGSKWIDPYTLMQEEECKAKEYTEDGMKNDKHCIASIMSQSTVDALYSGAAIVTSKKPKDVTIEGVKGFGDKFMLGEEDKQTLPDEVVKSVLSICDKFISYNDILGDVSFEWVYDGVFVWVVQLNQIPTAGTGVIIVEGNPEHYEDFEVKDGLQKLASKIKEIKDRNIGIRLIGKVGICSHFGDLLRQANIPSYLEDASSASAISDPSNVE